MNRLNIEHPIHYEFRGRECADIIRDFVSYPDYCIGNILKYLYRYPRKNGVEDLYKARQYIDMLIGFETGKLPEEPKGSDL